MSQQLTEREDSIETLQKKFTDAAETIYSLQDLRDRQLQRNAYLTQQIQRKQPTAQLSITHLPCSLPSDEAGVRAATEVEHVDAEAHAHAGAADRAQPDVPLVRAVPRQAVDDALWSLNMQELSALVLAHREHGRGRVVSGVQGCHAQQPAARELGHKMLL